MANFIEELYYGIIVERIADTEITDNTQLIDGKTYWVAAD